MLLVDFGQQYCVRWHGSKSLTGFKLYATSANIVVVPCKRTQPVGRNNVGCCWPTMLRPFAWALTLRGFSVSCYKQIIRVNSPNCGRKAGQKAIYTSVTGEQMTRTWDLRDASQRSKPLGHPAFRGVSYKTRGRTFSTGRFSGERSFRYTLVRMI